MSTEDGQAPPPKRVKTEEHDCDEAPFFTNDEGNSYFSIGGNRRCTIRKWKKQIFIDVREVSTQSNNIFQDFLREYHFMR